MSIKKELVKLAKKLYSINSKDEAYFLKNILHKYAEEESNIEREKSKYKAPSRWRRTYKGEALQIAQDPSGSEASKEKGPRRIKPTHVDLSSSRTMVVISSVADLSDGEYCKIKGKSKPDICDRKINNLLTERHLDSVKAKGYSLVNQQNFLHELEQRGFSAGDIPSNASSMPAIAKKLNSYLLLPLFNITHDNRTQWTFQLYDQHGSLISTKTGSMPNNARKEEVLKLSDAVMAKLPLFTVDVVR